VLHTVLLLFKSPNVEEREEMEVEVEERKGVFWF
jgi:hypothetical protein